jgi:3-hydroxyacyl-CoA dehydrogenase
MPGAEQVNRVARLERRDGIAILTLDSPPVNALSAEVRQGLLDGITTAFAAPGTKALVLICGGRTFFAGADVTEFGKPVVGPDLKDIQDAIEAAPGPVVAAIHGTALGGGLEIALACHHRVAARKALCGLPEVKLGLIPGAGGTQRLPRLVGIQKALEMITSGDPIGASAAHEAGLIDAVLPDEALEDGAIAFAREAGERRDGVLARKRTDRLGADTTVFDSFRVTQAKRLKGLAAPEAAIGAVQWALTVPFDEAVARERALFYDLMTGPQSTALRHVFFAERQVGRVPDLPEGTPAQEIRSVGIVGAGTMGTGIAMCFLNAGFPVRLVDANEAAIARARSTVSGTYDGAVAKGRITTAEAQARAERLDLQGTIESLADCDLVVEAVFEDMALKQSVFGRLDAIVRQDAILATNTSYLDVDAIAAVTSRPGQVLGLHFFSPAHIMRLVEIVRGMQTSPGALATALKLARTLGKVGVVVGNAHGFVGNRMLARRHKEAERLLDEGVMPWDVDRVHVAFGMPMGPFAMHDLAGLDIGWSREASRGETIVEILCEMDRRGQKTRAGFYDYDDQRRATPSPVAAEVVRRVAARSGRPRRPVADADILARCLLPMIDEGARILQEGKAVRASDIDVVWINGYGWPAWTGGPMHHGEQLGLASVVAGLDRFAREVDPSFAPCDLLRRLAGEGRGFT